MIEQQELCYGNKRIALYLVGKTEQDIKQMKTIAIGENLWIEACLYAEDYEAMKFNWDWNSIIKVLQKLTPELEESKEKARYELADEIAGLLCSIETHLTLYDIEMLWKRVVDCVDFLNKLKSI